MQVGFKSGVRKGPARAPAAEGQSRVFDAIATSTGISRGLLERIKLSMDQRTYYEMLRPFLLRGLVPGSSEILMRLLLNPRTGKVSADSDPARLFSEYHVMVNSSLGKLRISARLKVYGRRYLFRRQFQGRITIRYQLETSDECYEYRQEFFLQGPTSLKLKQLGFKRPKVSSHPSVLAGLMPMASPIPLLAPARAIYL